MTTASMSPNFSQPCRKTVIELSFQEATFLVALLESDRQTALQLLHAEHFYRPSLLPRLNKVLLQLKQQQQLKAEG